MKNTGETKPVSRSLAITLIAGMSLLLLLVYGAAGFLLYQYFRENTGPRSGSDAVEAADLSPNPQDQGSEEETLPPLLKQPEMEPALAYIRLETPVEKSPEQITALQNSVILLQAGDSRGAGVILSSAGHVLTAYHIIEPSPYLVRATLALPTNELVHRDLMLLGYDPQKDLALLQFKNSRDLPLQPLPMGKNADLSEGRTVVGIVNLPGVNSWIEKGFITGIRKRGEETLIQVSMPVEPHHSGGALLNLKGELAGLLSFRIEEAEELSGAVSADDISSWIDAHPQWINP